MPENFRELVAFRRARRLRCQQWELPVTRYGGLVAERRAPPRDDLLSRLIEAEVDGERLTDFEVTAHLAQLVAAGNQTTRNSLAGGLAALRSIPIAPGIDRRSQQDSGAVEEILRWHTPVMIRPGPRRGQSRSKRTISSS